MLALFIFDPLALPQRTVLRGRVLNLELAGGSCDKRQLIEVNTAALLSGKQQLAAHIGALEHNNTKRMGPNPYAACHMLMLCPYLPIINHDTKAVSDPISSGRQRESLTCIYSGNGGTRKPQLPTSKQENRLKKVLQWSGIDPAKQR